VKTGSIALPKFILFFFFYYYYYFSFFFCGKILLSGVKIFFSRFVSKNQCDTLAFLFLNGKFWSKKCLRTFSRSNELCQLLQLQTDLDEIFRNSSPKLGLTQF